MKQYNTNNSRPTGGTPQSISGQFVSSAPGSLVKKDKTMKPKYYEVLVRIPLYVEKSIYIDDATSKTDAVKKARAWLNGEYDAFDVSGDSVGDQLFKKGKVVDITEGGQS
tara:strand:+ start:243 stop:572 length:330 start_codon:yes stop_codon:yes gene_type:complete